ncbi:MAG TPA: GYF domain-containing protein [Clostridia bacterium]|nr:GYF domain-containing protein [Clostridia bacterium]
MYKIIGADLREYGPVTLEQLRQWITEGRVNGQTLVQPAGATGWRPLSTFPELAAVLAEASSAGGAAPADLQPPGVAPEILQRDYDLDIGNCIAKSLDLFKNNFGVIFGGFAVYLLLQFVVSGLGQIQNVGFVFSAAYFILTGPLTGGLYYFLLRVIRSQPVEIGDVFAGFRINFPQLLLGYLVISLLTLLSAAPGALLIAYPVYALSHEYAGTPLYVIWIFLGSFVVIIPVVYLSVSWIFSLPLIIDRRMEFWPAMETSRKMVRKHWWLVFGLVVITSLISLAGFLACCVGLVVTLPIGFGALMYAYEKIFSAPTTSAY